MKLPPDAIIAAGKLASYLLRWREADDKSAFLALAGYGPDDAVRLESDIREQLLSHDAEWIGDTEYGPKFRICAVLRGPNGRRLGTISIWMTEKATGATKFITLYPGQP